MSVTFYGKTTNSQPITLDQEHPAFLNMSCANARTFLLFLGLDPGEDLSGEVPLPDARRAIMRARATFDRRVVGFTRGGSDTKRPGRCRVIEGGVDPEYFIMRLDSFERFLNDVAERGARSIYWA